MVMEESYAPVKAVPGSLGAIVASPAVDVNSANRIGDKVPIGWSVKPDSRPPAVSPRTPRPGLSHQHWQMSPADCTQGLGMDLYGTDVATMMDAGWQVR